MTQTRIALGGKAGAGKDTVLGLLTQYRAGRLGVIEIGGFGKGGVIEREWRQVHGTVPTQQQLQRYGQERRQAEGLDYWPLQVVAWANQFDENTVVGLTGVRFPNELGVLRRGGFELGLIKASLETRIQRLTARDGYVWTEEMLNHPTEMGLDLIPDSAWDFVIIND